MKSTFGALLVSLAWFNSLSIPQAYAHSYSFDRVDEKAMSGALLCDDPVKAVCGDSYSTTSTIQQDRNNISMSWAMRLVEKRLAAAGIRSPKETQYQDAVDNLVFEIVGGIRPMIDRMILAYIQALPEIFPVSDDQVRALKILKGLQLYNAEILRRYDSRLFTAQCGTYGFRVNAFYFPMKNAIVVCPGAVFAAARAEGPGSEMTSPGRAFYGLAWILGHELGHAIDSRVFPNAFAGQVSALLKKYPHVNSKTHAETIADWLATRALRPVYNQVASTRSSADVQTVLLRGLLPARAILCRAWTGDSERQGYLEGPDRIRHLLGRTSGLREPLGCK